jgi:glycosyltransferase involved in cell wall biosynthesis
MKKILFISTRYPFPIFGGDKLRAFDILRFLSKKNQVNLVCLGKKNVEKNKDLAFCKSVKVFNSNFLSRIINTLLSLIRLEPLQNGFYLSKKMKNYIDSTQGEYDSIICHMLRSSQYLPDDFLGKKVLDSTDLLSSNYFQTIGQLSIFNPLKYIYFIEKFLVYKYEKKVFKKFNSIIFVSNQDSIKAKKIVNKKKIYTIGNAKKNASQLFKYKKKNNKIIFVGNIKYLPNKLACNSFAKNILKIINLTYPKIKFHIIGDIGYFHNFILSRYKNVIIHGKVQNLKKVVQNSICGLCNVKISTGFQNKILTYMSYGIPAVISNDAHINTKFKKNKEVVVFNNTKELIKKIFYLIENKNFSNILSNNSQKVIKRQYNLNKALSKYNDII